MTRSLVVEPCFSRAGREVHRNPIFVSLISPQRRLVILEQ
jgi:hypothetical protein